MSRTIDERIVEMQFNNKDFQENIQDSIDSLERLKAELDLSESAKGLNKLSRAGKSFSLANVTNSVDSIASKFSTMGIIGVTALQNLTNSAVNAGKRIASALTIQPVSTGFNEYELKMNAIKTIMSGSREDLETVTKALNELNEYSDQTIYSFSDMTQNIGKFTNAGVPLEDAVAAIKGISNEAALAGANANEASRAMYNFAQAMSSGYVKLIDWKSIELANMATVEFKEELIKTAVEMKTVAKTADGMYESLTTDMNGKQSEKFDAKTAFNDSLAHQWLNKDVLVKTLKRYSSTATDIGRRATEAATQVRTFTMLFDTLKESAQSGWATTWEIVVGDLDSATKMLTKMSDIFGSIISKSADVRNGLLGDWKNLGGRDVAIEGFKYLYDTLVKIGTVLKESFREFFPALTGKKLFEFTEKFRDVMKSLFELVEDNEATLRSVFTGFFSLLKSGIHIVKSLAKGLKNLIERLSPAGEGFSGLLERLGEYAIDVGNAIRDSEFLADAVVAIGNAIEWCIDGLKSFGEFLKEAFANVDMDGVAASIYKIRDEFKPLEIITTNASKVMEGLGKALEWVKKLLGNLAKSFGPAFSEIGQSLKDADLQAFLNAINTMLAGGLILGLTALINKIKKFFKDFGDIFEIFDDLGSLVSSHVFVNIAKGMAIVAGAMFLLSLVPTDKLATTMGTFAGMMTVMLAAVKTLDVLFKFGDKTGDLIKRTTGLQKVSISLTLLALSMLMMASAVKKLAKLELQEAFVGVMALAGIMAALVLTLKRFDSTDIPLQTAGAMLIMAAAIASLSRTLRTLGRMDVGELLLGYGALIAIVQAIVMTVNRVEEKSLFSIAASIVAIGIALKLLSSTIEMLGDMDIQAWAQGIGGVGALLLTLALAMKFMPKEKAALAGAIGIRVIANALNLLVGSVDALGKLEFDAVVQGVGALLVALAGLTIAMQFLGNVKMLAGAGALLILSGALMVLVPTIAALSSMPNAFKGVLVIAAALGVLIGAGILAGAAILPLLALAGVLALLGVGCLAAGAGMLLLAKGFALLAVSGVAGGAALTAALTGVMLLIPLFFAKLGEGIVAFADALADGSESMKDALVELGTNMYAGAIELGINMISSFVQGITRGIDEVGDDLTVLIATFWEKLSENVPYLVDRAMKFLGDFLSGLAEAINENAGDLADAGIALGEAVKDGFFIGLKKKAEHKMESVKEFGEDVLETLRETFDTHSPSKKTEEIGINVADGLVMGVKWSSPYVTSAFANLGKDSLDSLSSTFNGEIYKVGESCAENFSAGVASGILSNEAYIANEFSKANMNIAKDMRYDMVDPGMLRKQKLTLDKMESATDSYLTNVEIKTNKTRKEMTTGIGYGISHRLSMGLKLYSDQALKAAQDAQESVLRPMTTMSKNFSIDTSSVDRTFAKLAEDTSKLSASLDLENNVTINHTFDKLVIEGVNDKGEFVASSEYAVEKIITSLMRRQSRV